MIMYCLFIKIFLIHENGFCWVWDFSLFLNWHIYIIFTNFHKKFYEAWSIWSIIIFTGNHWCIYLKMLYGNNNSWGNLLIEFALCAWSKTIHFSCKQSCQDLTERLVIHKKQLLSSTLAVTQDQSRLQSGQFCRWRVSEGLVWLLTFCICLFQ